jgi:hypothetical protein
VGRICAILTLFWGGCALNFSNRRILEGDIVHSQHFHYKNRAFGVFSLLGDATLNQATGSTELKGYGTEICSALKLGQNL